MEALAVGINWHINDVRKRPKKRPERPQIQRHKFIRFGTILNVLFLTLYTHSANDLLRTSYLRFSLSCCPRCKNDVARMSKLRRSIDVGKWHLSDEILKKWHIKTSGIRHLPDDLRTWYEGRPDDVVYQTSTWDQLLMTSLNATSLGFTVKPRPVIHHSDPRCACSHRRLK